MTLAFGLLFAAFVSLLAACSGKAANDGPPIEPLLRSTVVVAMDDGQGSGLIIGNELVLTAYHVVRGRVQPSVRFLDGQSRPGKVIWSEPGRDLALVKVDVPKGYPAAPLHCDESIDGQKVIAVGHPLRSEWVAVSGRLPTDLSYGRNRYVSLGVSVGKGASGGPVFNHKGKVVGITLAILIKRPSAQKGMGYMLPASAFCQKIREKQVRYQKRYHGL